MVLSTDQILGRVMLSVRRMVETLPEEGLLREQGWRGLTQLVKFELSRYSKAFGDSLVRALEAASGRMQDYALREARLAEQTWGLLRFGLA